MSPPPIGALKANPRRVSHTVLNKTNKLNKPEVVLRNKVSLTKTKTLNTIGIDKTEFNKKEAITVKSNNTEIGTDMVNTSPLAPLQQEDVVSSCDEEDTQSSPMHVHMYTNNRRTHSDVECSPDNENNQNKRIRVVDSAAAIRTYAVYIKCKNSRVNITQLHPVKVRDSIVEQFHINGRIEKAGQSLRVHCGTEVQRNRFLRCGLEIAGQEIVCSLPRREGAEQPLARAEVKPQGLCRKVLRHVPPQVTLDELCAATGACTARPVVRGRTSVAQDQESGDVRVGERPHNHPVVLTFRPGDVPPAVIELGYLSVKLWEYVPEPRRCFQCQKFGHVAAKCRKQSPVCPVCAGEHKYEQCTNRDAPKCANCGQAHSASYKKCSQYQMVQKVLHKMAHTGASFSEARKNVIAEAVQTSVAQAVSIQTDTVTTAVIENNSANTGNSGTTTNTDTITEQTEIGTNTTEANTDITQVKQTYAQKVSSVVSNSADESTPQDTGTRGNNTVDNYNKMTTCTATQCANFVVMSIQLLVSTLGNSEEIILIQNKIKEMAQRILGIPIEEALQTN